MKGKYSKAKLLIVPRAREIDTGLNTIRSISHDAGIEREGRILIGCSGLSVPEFPHQIEIAPRIMRYMYTLGKRELR